MQASPLPPNEAERLQSLKEHQLLDTLPEETYDSITKIASEICGTPVALLTLLDEHRQWFKSKVGIDISETPREQAFCAYTILNPDDVLVVEDARYDERFCNNPLTLTDPPVVFYAGVPVKDSKGNAFGSLCVIDNRPRELSQQKLESLKALAKLVSCYFELSMTKNKFELIMTENLELKTKIASYRNS